MKDDHLAQANRNYKLYQELQITYPDDYFDWKITIIFYTALHLLHALSHKRNKPLLDRHELIKQSIGKHVQRKLFSFPSHAWDWYYGLFEYSCQARYVPSINSELYKQIHKGNHNHCLENFTNLKHYYNTQGLVFPEE